MRIAAMIVMGAAGLLAASPAMAQGKASPADVAAGKKAFMKCMACHATTAGAPAKVGPTLFGVVGKAAASQPGYRYSAALAGAKLTWNNANLDKWLARPMTMVPGTAMAFAGVSDAAERKAIIAYLSTLK
ncbi:c-type cytochrome [Novosphingobium ovatum]|nr:c-type cytochrome [Novosphingobium ovatum]